LKTPTHALRIRIAALAALALAAADAAAINKCVDRGGKVTYQDAGCPDDARQDTVKAPDAPVPSAVSNGAVDEETALGLASVQSTFEGCTAVSPEFSTMYASDYDKWRAVNEALLAKVERSPRYQQILQNGRDQRREQGVLPPGNMERFAQYCNVQFIPALRKAIAR
jgi:Domain of unknown function (DUF4124)